MTEKGLVVSVMNGLEIIERIPIEQLPIPAILILFVGIVFCVLVPSFAVYHLTKNIDKVLVSEIISGVIYIALVFGLLMSGVLEIPTGEYQYKVKITEDVGYVEFTDKYDVVADNDDGTYIIQEKNHIKE